MIKTQAGFVAWTTMDRCMAPPSIMARTKKSAKVPVPFTIFRTYVHTREVRDVQAQPDKPADEEALYRHIVPMGGISHDMQLMNIQTLDHLVQKAMQDAQFVRAIPYHAWSLCFSNLVGGAILSCNHLAIGVIADHVRTNRMGNESIKHTMAYRPANWKRLPRLRKMKKQHRNSKPIIDLVATNDFTRILPLDTHFKEHALLASDNITMDAFLGVCGRDTNQSLVVKYGPPENFARRRRMLGHI